jgi:hypothetical protein
MKKITILIVFVCIVLNVQSQILLQESFDGITFAPTGWSNARILPSVSTSTGIWDRATQSTNPTFNPRSGAAMARFNSWNISSNTESELITPAINLSGGGSYRLRFWIYRHSTNSLNEDKLDVYINTQTNITGALKLKTYFVSRLKTPMEMADGWYEVLVDIPASYNSSTNYIVFRATSKGANAVCIDDVTVETATCFVPVSPTVANVAQTSANINWQAPANGSPLGYEWEIRTVGSPGTGTAGLVKSGSTATGVTTESVAGLTQGISYSLYIRSSCGTEKSTWSDAVPFTTTCSAFTIPYNENFDAVSTGLPSCTSVENLNGGNQWSGLLPVYENTYSKSAPNCIISINGGTGNTGIQNDWFFTAPLALEAGKCYRLAFSYRVNLYLTPQSLQVKFGTSANALAMNSDVIFSNSSITSSSYLDNVSYISVTNSGTYYIGFHHNGGSAGGFLLIDDIQVQESIGVPVGVNVSLLTASSVTLSWNAPSCGNATTYEWELRSSGAAGSGAGGLFSSGSGNVLTTSFTGLTELTNYSFYIRSKTASFNSEWTSAATFQTPCNLRTIPFFENFDAVVSPNLPKCYVVQDITAPYNPLNRWQTVSFDRPYSGQTCLRIGTNNSTSNADNWLFTPTFQFIGGKSYRLTFYYRNSFYSYQEKLEVKYGKGTTVTAMVAAPIFTNTDIRNSVYKKAVVDFVPGETGNYSIGFHYISEALKNFVYIDDIKLEETPLCDVVQNLSAGNISATGVLVNWSLPLQGNPDGYEWEVRSAGNAGSGSPGLNGSGNLNAGVSSANISGLSSNTVYKFYIRSKCGSAFSVWDSLSFSSACTPVAVPYTENFNAVSIPNLPACATIEETKDHIAWRTTGGIANSAPYSLYHSDIALSTFDDWYFSAPLQLTADVLYRLTFFVREQTAGNSDALEVKLAKTFAQSNAVLPTAIYSNLNITNTSFQQVTVDFYVQETGVYYLGYHFLVGSNYRGLFVDDISVVETITTAVRDIVQPGADLIRNIYPNPAEDAFVLKVNRKYDAGKMIVHIRDLQGRLVKTEELNLGAAENYRIAANGLTGGMYLVETIHLRSGKKQTIRMRKK